MPSRSAILETIPLIISEPPKLRSKSSLGVVSATAFHSRSFVWKHPILSVIIFFLASFVAVTFYRRRLYRRAFFSSSSAGILGNTAASGAGFRHDAKEGLLNGGGNGAGKVD